MGGHVLGLQLRVCRRGLRARRVQVGKGCVAVRGEGSHCEGVGGRLGNTARPRKVLGAEGIARVFGLSPDNISFLALLCKTDVIPSLAASLLLIRIVPFYVPCVRRL